MSMSTLGTIRSIGNLRELKGTEGNLKEPCRTGRNAVKNPFGKRVTQQEHEEENEL